MNEESNEGRLEDLLAGLTGSDREEMIRTWRLASEAGDADLSPEEVSSAYERIQSRLGSGRNRTRVYFLRAAALAAAVVVGVLLGRLDYAPVERPAEPPPGSTVDGRYLILIWSDAPAGNDRDRKAVVAAFRRWAGDLAAEGRLVDAAELRDSGTILIPQANGVEREELSMNDERASGYFLIRASSLAEAEAIARDCPHLLHGGTIEIREVRAS